VQLNGFTRIMFTPRRHEMLEFAQTDSHTAFPFSFTWPYAGGDPGKPPCAITLIEQFATTRNKLEIFYDCSGGDIAASSSYSFNK